VRPIAVATCDLDAASSQVGATPGPFALGHEFVADVLEVAPDVGVRPGDRAIVPFQVSCGVCDRCRRGPPQLHDGGRAPRMGWHRAAKGRSLSDVVRAPYADAMSSPPGLEGIGRKCVRQCA
jgi:alcohol dehydrogenase